MPLLAIFLPCFSAARPCCRALLQCYRYVHNANVYNAYVYNSADVYNANALCRMCIVLMPCDVNHHWLWQELFKASLPIVNAAQVSQQTPSVRRILTLGIAFVRAKIRGTAIDCGQRVSTEAADICTYR